MNGVEAWISDEGKAPLSVYGVEKDATTGVMSCWIAYDPGMVCSNPYLRGSFMLSMPFRTLRFVGGISTVQWISGDS